LRAPPRSSSLASSSSSIKRQSRAGITGRNGLDSAIKTPEIAEISCLPDALSAAMAEGFRRTLAKDFSAARAGPESRLAFPISYRQR
jgi:hypothetical protein